MSRQKKQSRGKPPIGKAELELLSYLHDRHPATVRDVADHLASTRGVVRTTVLNMMSRLVAKGYLTRKRIDGIYRYSPSTPRSSLLKNLVRDFIHTALGGSVSPFVAYLSSDATLSDEELAELKQLLLELERRKENAA
ncbi:MAG: BlaI/MecI/CopY family transcriptional regulator [Phycisphaerae bacterium]